MTPKDSMLQYASTNYMSHHKLMGTFLTHMLAMLIFMIIFQKSEKPKISKNPGGVTLRAAYLKISCKGAEGIQGIIRFPDIFDQE